MPTPTPHGTETKKAEADQAEGGGFGDGGKLHFDSGFRWQGLTEPEIIKSGLSESAYPP